MAVTREQFDAGVTYDAYKAQMTRNKEQVEQNEKDLQLNSDDVKAIQSLPNRLNVRVLLRDQDPGAKVMDEHLNKGQYKSIPTVIFLDGDFNEVGVWVERPESVTKLREEKRLELYKQNPAWGDPSKPIAELPEDVRTTVQQKTGAMRNETKPFANSEVVRELRGIAERATSKQPV